MQRAKRERNSAALLYVKAVDSLSKLSCIIYFSNCPCLFHDSRVGTKLVIVMMMNMREKYFLYPPRPESF